MVFYDGLWEIWLNIVDIYWEMDSCYLFGKPVMIFRFRHVLIEEDPQMVPAEWFPVVSDVGIDSLGLI